MMYASLLRLNRVDLKNLKITDNYSIHRVVYDLFDDVRSLEEKNASVTSGLLYVDKGGDYEMKEILILSDRAPKNERKLNIETKKIDDEFLNAKVYQFEVVVNPTKRDSKSRKLIPIRGRESIAHWFYEKAPSSWGFDIKQDSLVVEQTWVSEFNKSNHRVIHSAARLSGQLIVSDQELFVQSFKKGIGRGRAFGFGLLQIIPLKQNKN